MNFAQALSDPLAKEASGHEFHGNQSTSGEAAQATNASDKADALSRKAYSSDEMRDHFAAAVAHMDAAEANDKSGHARASIGHRIAAKEHAKRATELMASKGDEPDDLAKSMTLTQALSDAMQKGGPGSGRYPKGSHANAETGSNEVSAVNRSKAWAATEAAMQASAKADKTDKPSDHRAARDAHQAARELHQKAQPRNPHSWGKHAEQAYKHGVQAMAHHALSRMSLKVDDLGDLEGIFKGDIEGHGNPRKADETNGLAKSDLPGHEFRGNQYKEAAAAASKASSKADRATFKASEKGSSGNHYAANAAHEEAAAKHVEAYSAARRNGVDRESMRYHEGKALSHSKQAEFHLSNALKSDEAKELIKSAPAFTIEPTFTSFTKSEAPVPPMAFMAKKD